MTTGTTRLGFITVNGDDPITNGDNVITTLSTQVDTHLGRMASGRQQMPGNSTDVQTAAITFPVGRFTASPQIVVSHGSSDPSSRVVAVLSPTATGFTITARAQAGGAYQVYWIASQT